MFELRVVLLVFFTLCLFEVCQTLKTGNVGVCQVEVAVKKTRTKTYVVTSNKWCGKKKCTYRKTRLETYIEKRPTPTCCEGWEYFQSDDTCKPQCRLGCEGGTCVAPDDCRCQPPLTFRNHTCVEPKCQNTCVNARCTSEDVCSCDDGLSAINSTHCGPMCLAGYANDLHSLDCVPQCDSPCVNGTCYSPNECSCLEGYTIADKYTCVPQCKPAWILANCTSLDLCTCFTQDSGCCCLNNADRQWKCSSLCDVCSHGQCTAPDTCVCDLGYSRKEYSCTPDCAKNCTNSYCSEPDVCTCESGYEKDPSDPYSCIPVCDPKCVNATCVAPNRCSCNQGYRHILDLKSCSPVCDDCVNGQCIAPGVCSCDKGYSKKNDTIGCTPDCDETCHKGSCTKPNFCTCDEGYEIDDENKFRCVPKCLNECLNAVCVLPDVCNCTDGFEPSNSSFACKPKCKYCDHGDCISPGVCKCHEGYITDKNDICTPVCTHPCINGKCIFPDECSCEKGYTKNKTVPNVCSKPCNDCKNGSCNFNDECVCDFGFEIFNGTSCHKIPIGDCKECEKSCSDELCCCRERSVCCIIHNEIESAGITSNTRMATLKLAWLVGAALALFLIVLVLIVMQRLWKRSKCPASKHNPNAMNAYGSVIYTVPDTLLRRNEVYDDNIEKCEDIALKNIEDKGPEQCLLSPKET